MEDEDDWTLEALVTHDFEPGNMPSFDASKRLLEEHYEKWTNPSSTFLSPANCFAWACGKLGINADTYRWQDDAENKLVLEYARLTALKRLFVFHKNESEADEEVVSMLQTLSQVVSIVNHQFVVTGMLVSHANPDHPGKGSCVGKYAINGMFAESAFEQEMENVFDHKEDKNDNFQNLFLHLRSVLQGLNLRRAGGKFFRRTITTSGCATLAFEEEMTVDQFVANYSNYMNNFKAWRWATRPPVNFQHAVDYLTNRPIAEAPDLEENCDMRSFDGDSVGRYSGVYDCRSDFFFEYRLRSEWEVIAAEVTRKRRILLLDDQYVCKAPDPMHVCVVHFECCFPYNTLYELQDLDDEAFYLRWREVKGYECVPSDRIESSALAELLGERIEADTAFSCLPDRVGARWIKVDNVPPNFAEVDVENLDERLLRRFDTDEADVSFASPPFLCSAAQYVRHPSDDPPSFFVPLTEPGGFPRASLSDSEWTGLGVTDAIHSRSFVRLDPPPEEDQGTQDGGGAQPRFFMPDTGRSWEECRLPELDVVYTSQDFCDEDLHMIYAAKGRLFFKVGERDKHQFTFMIEGPGGCGKSTVMGVQMQFWPPHLRGILSSNMQAQFGMAAVMRNGKSKVIFCNEVAENLNVVQEEWQVSTSGEYGSFSVKFQQEPLCMKCEAQHFWVGNSGPKKWDNRQKQVSRRLAGVLFVRQVKPRDGHIMDKLKRKMGVLLRREALAYNLFVYKTGSIDPMSVPEKLPPAFRAYYERGCRLTDPVEDMLSGSRYVEVKEGRTMLLKEFKEIYNAYRVEYDMGKAVRWGEDVYRTAFSDRSIKVVQMPLFTDESGMSHMNVDVIHGIGLLRHTLPGTGGGAGT